MVNLNTVNGTTESRILPVIHGWSLVSNLHYLRSLYTFGSKCLMTVNALDLFQIICHSIFKDISAKIEELVVKMTTTRSLLGNSFITFFLHICWQHSHVKFVHFHVLINCAIVLLYFILVWFYFVCMIHNCAMRLRQLSPINIHVNGE